MNELELLRRVRSKVPPLGRQIGLGIGDDCAVLRQPGAKEDLLITTDMLIEDVHFRRETHPAGAVGWRALARGLSDIAAMGGTPRFCLVSLALAPWADGRWVDAFYRGFLRLAKQTGTALVGGDLAHAEHVVCDVVVCGSVEKGKAMRRDRARPGNRVYVSGPLGASALGLRTRRGEAWRRHLRPQPRLELGRLLRSQFGVAAAMDLSDGLSLDLHRLCLESGVAAELEGSLPIFPGATIEDALHGGEDYELLFTVRPNVSPPGTRIGTIRKGKPGVVLFAGRPLALRGYNHFRERLLAVK
jgi:thiamine-monophosphate kinase